MLLPALLLPLLTCLQREDARPAARFILDGVTLASPRAVVSPLGWVEVTGRPTGSGEGAPALVKLRFPQLAWPAAGEHAVSEGDLRAFVGTPAEEGAPVGGKLVVEEVGPHRVCFTLRFARDGEEHTAEVDMAAELYVPKMQPKAEAFTAPVLEPNEEDLVLCLLGNGGTGLPGQRQVAESMAEIAPSGPLDLVVLLGNNFMPDGVTSERDPLFRSRFEEVYDPRRLGVPFYVVQGPADHRGAFDAAQKYGVMNSRWTTSVMGFRVELPCHGKRIGLFGGESVLLGGSLADSRTRTAFRALFDLLHASKADWKVVFTHHQLLPLGGSREPEAIAKLEERSRYHIENGKADLLVSADGRGLRLVVPEKGVPQVMAGGGGGPEMGTAVEEVPGTKFAYGGGGTAWLRFTGETLVVTFHDASGKLLYAHTLRKP